MRIGYDCGWISRNALLVQMWMDECDRQSDGLHSDDDDECRKEGHNATTCLNPREILKKFNFHSKFRAKSLVGGGAHPLEI